MEKTRININNYEAFFLDHFEGRLSKSEERELLAFLEIYPQIKAEFESFSLINIAGDETLKFPGKELLKKGPSVYDEMLIAYMEGDLSPGEIRKAEKLIHSDPLAGEELNLLRLTQLQPDRGICFPYKKDLRKQPVVRYLYYSAAAVAACLALLLLFRDSPGPLESDAPSYKAPLSESHTPVKRPERLDVNKAAPLSAVRQPAQSYRKPLRSLVPASPGDLKPVESIAEPSPAYVPEPILALDTQKPKEEPAEQYMTFLQAAGNFAKSKLEKAGERSPLISETLEKKKLPGLSEIAEHGVNGLARLTGADIRLKKTVDTTSAVACLTLDIGSFQLSRTYQPR